MIETYVFLGDLHMSIRECIRWDFLSKEEPLRIFSCDTKALLVFFEFGKLFDLMSKDVFCL